MSGESDAQNSALSTEHSALGLIADDLTGALDAGAGFVRYGLRAVLPFSGRPEDASEADVALVNTETRDEPDSAVAHAAVREAAGRLHDAGVPGVYKKIDSVLRGHPGPELAAVLDVYGGRALVAPAFPAQGRTTQGGTQLLHGRPVEPFGGDLRAALGDAAERCDIRDAATDEDLSRLAHDVAQQDYHVWCGTAGLAAHAPDALRLQPGHGPPPRLPPVEHVLVFAGTNHPATNAQLDRLRKAAPDGVRVVIEGRQYATRRDVGAALRRAARSQKLGPGVGLLMTGGETALIVCRALAAVSIEVTSEALPGIPLGLLRLPDQVVPIATKSGGFGRPDALLETAEAMVTRR